MNVSIEKSWKDLLSDEFEKEYFQQLVEFIKHEYMTQTIYPKGKDIFKAFDFCPVDKVKVVILGQDPYHGKGQAHGLCFSVPEGIRIPPSLLNIYKELKTDVGKEIPLSGNLEHWSDQGVLLLNATLTVRAGQAGSHQNKGWETFTDAVIEKLSRQKEHLVFMLWGAYAQNKGQVIDKGKHYVLESPHPSPFSANRGFFGNKHFSLTNEYLRSKALSTINW
jgi:uracil-DNA glycosylase